MNYIGSKFSLLNFLEETILSTVNFGDKKPENLYFTDLFAGTGVVSAKFKELGYNIISNDIQYYSYVLSKAALLNISDLKFEKLIEEKIISSENPTEEIFTYLNNLKEVEGFVFNNYCLTGTKEKEFPRQYFSDDNGKKCDAIRKIIEEWHIKSLITESEYFYLLAALIDSIDRYANTASVYGAFLKKLKKSALGKFHITPYSKYNSDQNDKIRTYMVYNRDANNLIREIEGDILYLDPPYNRRQYCDNYHVLETIAKYDNPILKGVTGLRIDSSKSKYCSTRLVKEIFRDLIENANFKYIFLSYNDEGLLSLEDIREIFSEFGTYLSFEKKYKRYKADSKRNNKKTETTEYIHCLIKN